MIRSRHLCLNIHIYIHICFPPWYGIRYKNPGYKKLCGNALFVFFKSILTMNHFYSILIAILGVLGSCILIFWVKILRHLQARWGFPGDTVVKNMPGSTGDTGDVGSIPGSGRPPGERNGNPFQYSCLKNPIDGEAWQAIVHGVAKRQTQPSD